MGTTKVIHVEFREPINGRRHFYFGSKLAIWQHFTEEQLGIKYKSFCTRKRQSDMDTYINDKMIVRQGHLITCMSAKRRAAADEFEEG